MSGFSVEWLALREPIDGRARNADVLAAVAAHFAAASALRIVDLGSGTGSTLRATAARLPKPQHWLLTDHDAELLTHARMVSDDTPVQTRLVDLNRDLASLFELRPDLITASALIDLVSAQWLADFVERAVAGSQPVYIALSYDGRVVMEGADDFDAAIVAAVNAHQRTDKGFGAALGPDAASVATAMFEAHGWEILQGQSDWIARGSEHAFQRELLNGWASAAREMNGVDAAAVDDWLARRLASSAAGQLTLRVGHLDFFARPRGSVPMD